MTRDERAIGAPGADGQTGRDVAGQEDADLASADSLAPRRLTRRDLLVTAAAASAVTLVACSPLAPPATKSTATPFTLGRAATIGVDGSIPAAMQQSLAQKLAGVSGGANATLVPATQTPDLVFSFGAVPAGYVSVDVGASPLTIVANMRVPVDNVTAEQARKLLGGQITNWSEVGAPYSLPVRVLALAAFPLPDGVQLLAGAKTLPTADDLLAAVAGQLGSVAAIPVELANWTVRNLGVDGVYPAQARGDASKAPFAPCMLRMGVEKSLASKGLDGRSVATSLKAVLAASAATLDMVSAGDIMLGRGVNNKMLAYSDYAYPYKGIHDELASADYRVANLECTITDLVPPPTDPATFTFLSAKRAVDGLTYAGFNTLTVANNHSNGPGHTPFMDMLKTLRDNKIGVIGGGENLADARQPDVQTIKGVRFAILGYHDFAVVPAQGPAAEENSWGLAPLNLATLPQDIAAARAKADIVIPYFHWGIEYHKVPTRDQQRAARAAIDAGADMVLGNHPHWTQGIESYKGKLIIYSMGNFVFDQDWSRPTMEGMLIHLYWRGTTLASVRFVPTIDKDRCQPNPQSQADAVGVFARMWSGTDLLAAGQYGIE